MRKLDSFSTNSYSWYIDRRTLLFRDVAIEREFEYSYLQTRKSYISLFVYCVTPCYMFTVYWVNLLQKVSHEPAILPLFFICIIFFIVSSGLSIYCMVSYDDDTLVYNNVFRRVFALSALSKLANYSVLFYLQGYYDMCHPTSLFNNICSRGEYPSDLLFCLLFTTAMTQIGFPSFSWGYAIIIQIISIVIACICTPLFDSSLKIPLLIWGSTFITAAILIRRRDTVSHFLLTKDTEVQKELEQQAKLGDRLRLMISGVAHDLKSPLSALSLGLESISVIHDTVRSIVYDIPSKEEQLAQTTDLLYTIKDLGQWLDNSRRAMTTIISRFVDVNQALNGVPLVPMIRDIDVKHTIDTILQHYSDDHQHVKIIPHIDAAIVETNHGQLQTDALWFRESVGCLISNAIKFCDYSDIGHLHEDQKQHINVYVTRVVEDSNVSLSLQDWGQRISKSYYGPNSRSNSYTDRAPSLQDCHVRVEVWDEGLGIDKELEKTLFSFLGHAQQVRVGGAGLGLGALACRIRTLGGRYGYETRMHRDNRRGSIFWFEVPYEPLVFTRQVVEEKLEEGRQDEAQNNSNIPINNDNSNKKPQVSDRSNQTYKKQTVASDSYHQHHHVNQASNISAVSNETISSKKSKKSINALQELHQTGGSSSHLLMNTAVGMLQRVNSGLQQLQVHPQSTTNTTTSSNNNLTTNHSVELLSLTRADSTVHRITEEVRLQLLGEDSAANLMMRSTKQAQHRQHANSLLNQHHYASSNSLNVHRSPKHHLHNSQHPSPNKPSTEGTPTKPIEQPSSASLLPNSLSPYSSSQSSPEPLREAPILIKPGFTPHHHNHANHHYHHPQHNTSNTRHNNSTTNGVNLLMRGVGNLSNSRVIPVDDDYAPYEAKLERIRSMNSLASIKEFGSDSHSVKSSQSSKQRAVARVSSPMTAPPQIFNMPMVAEAADSNNSSLPNSPLAAKLAPLDGAPSTPTSNSHNHHNHYTGNTDSTAIPNTTTTTDNSADNNIIDSSDNVKNNKHNNVDKYPFLSASAVAGVSPSQGDLSGASATGSYAITSKHVLIVDDSMPIRKMSSMILKQHGHHVVTAMNGKEALQMMIQAFDLRIQRHRITQLHADQKNDADYYTSSNSYSISNSGVAEFDLVLMDIQMPVMDGIEAVALYRRHETQQLQKLAQLNNNSNKDTTNDANDGNNHQNSSSDGVRRLLIIGMSACSDVDTIERGLSVGMDRFVAKPFQIQQLTPILHEYFHNDGNN